MGKTQVMQPGAALSVVFELTKRDLSYWNSGSWKQVTAATAHIGASSEDIRLSIPVGSKPMPPTPAPPSPTPRPAPRPTPSPQPSPPQKQCTGTATGQRSVYLPGCYGAGCYGGDCAFCVYDMAACTQAYGSICQATFNARKAQGVIGCTKEQGAIGMSREVTGEHSFLCAGFACSLLTLLLAVDHALCRHALRDFECLTIAT